MFTNMQVMKNMEGINAQKRIMIKLQSNANRLEWEPNTNKIMELMEAWVKRKGLSQEGITNTSLVWANSKILLV